MDTKNIIVVGDICLDWFHYTYSYENPRDKKSIRSNWQNALNTKMFQMPGGVMLLNSFIESATGTNTYTHNLPNIKNYPSSKMINSFAEIRQFPKRSSHNTCFRINKFLGYTGPEEFTSLDKLEFPENMESADLVIIDDTGNGFRNSTETWEKVVQYIASHTKIIYKMSWPLFQGVLFEEIIKSYAHQVVLIIHADDLREEGLNISRRLSWEKTILDFILKLPVYKEYQSFSRCDDVIIRFGMEGAIHYHFAKRKTGHQNRNAVLHYYPDICEGELLEKTDGKMQGLTSAFVAWIARYLLVREQNTSVADQLESAIPSALAGARELLSIGFNFENGTLAYPIPKIFQLSEENQVKKIILPLREAKELNQGEWSILHEETQLKSDLDIAMKYVIEGSSADLQSVPIVHFNHMLVIDRNEVEKFRTVSNLMKEYFRKEKSSQPLSIGVFGPPGSGKSFGVKQLVKDIMDTQVSTVEFNLSQFQSLQELTRAFHKIRDYTLKGIVPLIFFDEFDSALNSESLGWLKYFLAPMQDGEFRDGDAVHPIGKAIFIFAGGTSSSFSEFSREKEKNSQAISNFKKAKGPDFVSRLKGYVDITGINQTDITDRFHVIRRAVILRVLLKNQKSLVDNLGKIYIDEDVLRALLLIPEYKHGNRSMGSIIEMSMLAGKARFEKSALPPKEQMDLHVNGDIFSKLLDKDMFFATVGEDLAKEIHAHYLENQKENIPVSGTAIPSFQSWEDLREDLKDSNRHQVQDLLVKLLQVKCFFRRQPAANSETEQFLFTEQEMELLAEMEHKRWNSDKINNGWRYGKQRDDTHKIHDCLTSWRHLPEEVKNYDRDAIKAIPDIFNKIGYEVYRILE